MFSEYNSLTTPVVTGERKLVPARHWTCGLILAALFVSFHLSVISCAILGYEPWKSAGPVSELVNRYGIWTGASNRYTFFAPGVANQILAEVTTVDRYGLRHTRHIGGRHGEVDHRLGTMMFWYTKAGLNDLEAWSLAALDFGRYPNAKQVSVSIKVHEVNPLREYKPGSRTHDREFYNGVFALKSVIGKGVN